MSTVPPVPQGQLEPHRGTMILVFGILSLVVCFIFGIDNTTASNSALLMAMTPVMVATIGTLAGVERPGVSISGSSKKIIRNEN